ncbi:MULTISPECIES: hypothetical protein [unclassified Pseudomonas]|uniref:hypothetical protein n=1 Tax=unclassified Pseudomonas TaxID=196821 RepID=UPI00385BBD0E
MKLGNIFHSNKIIESDNFIDMACKKSGHKSISNKTAEHLVRAINADYKISRGLASLIVLDKNQNDKSLDQLSKENKHVADKVVHKVSRLLGDLKSVNQSCPGKVLRGMMGRCELMLRESASDKPTKVRLSNTVQVKDISEIDGKLKVRELVGDGDKSPLKSALKIHQPINNSETETTRL